MSGWRAAGLARRLASTSVNRRAAQRCSRPGGLERVPGTGTAAGGPEFSGRGFEVPGFRGTFPEGGVFGRGPSVSGRGGTLPFRVFVSVFGLPGTGVDGTLPFCVSGAFPGAPGTGGFDGTLPFCVSGAFPGAPGTGVFCGTLPWFGVFVPGANGTLTRAGTSSPFLPLTFFFSFGSLVLLGGGTYFGGAGGLLASAGVFFDAFGFAGIPSVLVPS